MKIAFYFCFRKMSAKMGALIWRARQLFNKGLSVAASASKTMPACVGKALMKHRRR